MEEEKKDMEVVSSEASVPEKRQKEPETLENTCLAAYGDNPFDKRIIELSVIVVNDYHIPGLKIAEHSVEHQKPVSSI